LKLVLYTIPFCSIGRGIFLFGDIWPDIGQFGIDFKKYFLPFRALVFCKDRAYGTLRFTERAVDALVWVDYQKVGAFIKTVYRANFYTVCVLALDAVVSDDKGHGLALVSMFGVPIRAAL
jgi:hypothetical protein